MPRRKAKTDGAAGLRFLTREQGRQLFERRARQLVGMTGEEFERKWRHGEFADPDRPELMQLAMLLPLRD